MWNDDGDTAVLFDTEGNEIDRVEEKPLTFSHEVKKRLHWSYSKVEIQKLDLLKDYVTIINKSKADVDISGWFLKSLIGSQSFVFPESIVTLYRSNIVLETVLVRGSTVTVWSGKEAEKKANPPNSMFWTKRF